MMYLVQEITEEDIELAKSIRNCGIDFNGNKEKNYDLDSYLIKKCVEDGMLMGAWTIDDPEVMKIARPRCKFDYNRLYNILIIIYHLYSGGALMSAPYIVVE